MGIVKENGHEYIDDVEITFEPRPGGHNNCECECCHRLDTVKILRLPSTLYHDGKRLTTKYYTWWICPDCERKLRAALEADT